MSRRKGSQNEFLNNAFVCFDTRYGEIFDLGKHPQVRLPLLFCVFFTFVGAISWKWNVMVEDLLICFGNMGQLFIVLLYISGVH